MCVCLCVCVCEFVCLCVCVRVCACACVRACVRLRARARYMHVWGCVYIARVCEKRLLCVSFFSYAPAFVCV